MRDKGNGETQKQSLEKILKMKRKRIWSICLCCLCPRSNKSQYIIKDMGAQGNVWDIKLFLVIQIYDWESN